jgi:hypothetical protein
LVIRNCFALDTCLLILFQSRFRETLPDRAGENCRSQVIMICFYIFFYPLKWLVLINTCQCHYNTTKPAYMSMQCNQTLYCWQSLMYRNQKCLAFASSIQPSQSAQPCCQTWHWTVGWLTFDFLKIDNRTVPKFKNSAG